jgi:hypothetical protein
MSLKHLVIVSILGCSSLAFADKPADAGQRQWTILAASNHDAYAQSQKPVSDPGVLVTAQRDPHDKK